MKLERIKTYENMVGFIGLEFLGQIDPMALKSYSQAYSLLLN